MLFRFCKYIQPTSYFSKFRNDASSVFPIFEELPSEIKGQLEKDTRYKSNLAVAYDLSWQALQKGYIGNATTYAQFEKLPVVDEYRFVRKYFNSLWAYYILGIRLVSFKNPFKELSGFLKSRKISRSNYLETPIVYQNWNTYESKLLASNPLVSVIIPTLNRYEYLKDVIEDLEKQDYTNFEIIVVDQTTPFNANFYKQFSVPVKVHYQNEKALWLARNFAIQHSKGSYFLLFDDDSRVKRDWISNHLKCLDFFNASISSGTSISKVGSKVPINYSFFRISDQLDTGNVLIKKEVFDLVGLFDRQFEKQRMGDGEFGLRSTLAGFLNVSNPFSERLHLKVGTGGLRQMGSWDGFRPKSWFAPRPIPSVLYYFRKYHGNQRSRYALLKLVPPSLLPYRFKKNKFLALLGFLLLIFVFPLVLFQVARSWKLASKKLSEGPKINSL